MIEHGPVQISEIGTPTEISEVEDDYGRRAIRYNTGVFEVPVHLNIPPSGEWEILFYNPSSWVTYPYVKDFRIEGNVILFKAREEEFKKCIEQLKNYISQANTAWEEFKEKRRQQTKIEEQMSQEKAAREEEARKKLQGLS